MSDERRGARLQAWIDRELRALLRSDDTAIVRAYVMGLVRGFGFPAAPSPQPPHGRHVAAQVRCQEEPPSQTGRCPRATVHMCPRD